MFTDMISNEVKLRELKDAIINELHRKMAASSKTKLSCSIQTKSQMKTALLWKKDKMKNKEDLIKTLLDAIKDLTAGKSHL